MTELDKLLRTIRHLIYFFVAVGIFAFLFILFLVLSGNMQYIV